MRGQMDHTLEKHVMTPLPVIDRVRQVEGALVEFVERADLKPGSRLPAERELMSALGVGRSTIREVIRKFQALGIIDSRKGSGNYLLKADFHRDCPYADFHRGAEPARRAFDDAGSAAWDRG